MLLVTRWPIGPVIIKYRTEILAPKRTRMLYIALPGIGPADVLDEFSRLPERKIDARDPGPDLLNAFSKE